MKNTKKYCYAKKENSYKYNELRKLHSCGNTKLPKSTLIFNMGDCHTCPSYLLGLCELRSNYKYRKVEKNVCYGLQPEKMYPDCLPYRLRQKNYWLTVSAEQFIDNFVEIQKRKRDKFTLIRFNESGDFYSQACVNKLYEIAAGIYEKTGVKSYCYTHRVDLNFRELKKYRYCLIITKSGELINDFLPIHYTAILPKNWSDVLKEVEANKKNKHRQFPKFICCGDCKKCTLCSNFPKLAGIIYTKIH